ncbi:lipopolysaccharide core heptosyltransferase RfaQ [bacterium BMS3Abin10]|nr:lipopolysaccharide core heptosyltransferase RfaQ [bacterium BMS3Abin10]GBE39554.1 lipopolysaccharide core heptosyltransferase RfaQ [bacterium BMS3Bbin08]
MTLCAAEKLMEQYPVNLSVAVSNNGSQELALSQFPKGRVYIWDESDVAAKNVIRLGRKLRHMCFDRVYLAYPSYKREGVVGLLTKAREKKVLLDGAGDWKFLRKIYKSKIWKPANMHDINANYALFGVESQGCLNPGGMFRRKIENEYGNYADSFFSEGGLADKFVIAVHPGANGDGKRWGTDKLIKLCGELHDRFACRFVIVGGSDELKLKQTVAKGIGESAVPLDSATLFQTASIIQRCSLFIGNDSAPMHISAVLGVPVVALWSYTDFHRTSPYGPGNIIIRKAYPCSPCYSFNGSFTDNCKFGMKCIKNLELDDVLPVVSHCVEVMLDKKRRINAEDVNSLKLNGIEKVYGLEHGCVVVDFRG